jgi:putative transposase
MVLGFYVSFNAPSAHGVLQCLKMAVFPKDALLSRYPDIHGQWPACGLPDLLAVDNGPDLHADAIEQGCLEMGIEVLFCPVKKPWSKGTIERFMRTAGEGLIHRLPGTVFSSVDSRGDYRSEEEAVIDFPTLIHLLTKWMVDIYSVTPHRGIECRPIDRWLDGMRGRTIEFPVYPQQVEVMIGIPATRTIFHYGIELDGLTYNNELLQAIRRRTGNHPKVNLKFYEDTVAHIHVFDPHAEEYIEVPAVASEYAAGLRRPIHRLIRENARRRFGESANTQQVLEARAEIEEIIRQAMKDKRMATRKQGAGLTRQDSAALFADKDPLQSAQQPVKDATQRPPDDLPPGLDDDLPDISGYAPEDGHDS